MIALNVWLTVKETENVPRVRELLAEQARLSRSEPGCLRFEVYHSQGDAARFLLVERWASREALDAHRVAHAFKTVYEPLVLPLVDRDPHLCDVVE